jgi:hypothetical protein
VAAALTVKGKQEAETAQSNEAQSDQPRLIEPLAA